MVFRLSSNPVTLAAVRIQTPRRSRRRGNPEPFASANTVMAAPTRRVDGGRASTSFPNHVGRQPGLWIPAAARMTGAGGLWITMKIVHFHPHVWPRQGHGNSRRRGNPEPFSPSNLIESAGMVRVERRPVHQARHNCRNRLGAWPGLWIPAATGMTGRRLTFPPDLWLAERQEIRVMKAGETSRPTRIAVAPLSKARGHAPG